MKNLKRNQLLFICSIISLFFLQQSSSYTLTGNVIIDLDATQDKVGDFYQQASTWTASNLIDPDKNIVSLCGDTPLLGGFNILGPSSNTNNQYFEQTYYSLPTHNNMYFSIGFWAIDSWDAGDYAQIYFHNTYWGTFYFRSDYSNVPNICGDPGKLEIPSNKLEGQLPHSDGYFNIKIYSRFGKSSMTASFGIRDIKLTFDTIFPAATSLTYCVRSTTTIYGNTRCTCATNQYESPSSSGSCVNCSSSCATCYGSASTNCNSCYPGKVISGNQCVDCDGSCAACSASGPSGCTACAAGKYLNAVNVGSCTQCHTNCATCMGTATNCTSCPAGRYKSGNTCPTCHASCATCTGPNANQCVTCPSGNFLVSNNTCLTSCNDPLISSTDGTNKFCDSPCTDLTKFAYWDKTCQTACDYPLSVVTIGPFQICNYTCGSSYLFWNGTCGMGCPKPWDTKIKNSKNFCVYPCSAGQFLYSNGSCGACAEPLKQRTSSDNQQFCDYPCASSEFLLWNGTCTSSCPSPYVPSFSGIFRFCNYPCGDGKYYYWNNTCSSNNCSAPLTLRVEGGTKPKNFCDLNCSAKQYKLWNGSCADTCETPLKTLEANGPRLCKPPCDTNEYWFADLGGCGKECPSPRYVGSDNTYNYSLCIKPPAEDKGGSLPYFLLNAPQVNEYSLVVPTTGMKYLQFLDVKLPSRLQKLAGSQGKFLFSPRFGLSAPDSLIASFSRLLLGEVLTRNGFHTSFLVNFWDGLLTLAIVLVITLVLTIFENVLQKTKGFLKTIHGIIERLMVMGGFNYVILVYASSIGEIVVYTYVEIVNLTSVNASLIIGVLMTLLIIPFIAGIIIVNNKAKQFDAFVLKTETADKYKKFAIKWRACQIFIRGMKHESAWQRFFFLIYTIRVNIQMIIAVFLVSIPIAAAIIPIIINVLMIAYLAIKRPLQKKVNLINLLVFEGISLVLNLCVFIVVIVCSSNDCQDGIALVLGDIVVVGTDILNILVIVFLAIKVAIEANSIRNFLKEYPNHSKAIWTNLFGILAQQTGMGFEEVIEESSIPEAANKYIGLLLRTKSMVAKEKAELLKSKSRSQIFPEERKSINDTEHFMKKTEISSNMIPANSALLTNADVTVNPPESPQKLKTRVKNVINNISSKKNGFGLENNTALSLANASPTFSIDLTDNSPAPGEGGFLLKHADSLESPVSQLKSPENGTVFFPVENVFNNNSPASNYEDKRLLNLTPIPTVETPEMKPLKIADEVGLDDYLKQFGLLSDDQNKASTNVNRKNLSRSPTLKSKKK